MLLLKSKKRQSFADRQQITQLNNKDNSSSHGHVIHMKLIPKQKTQEHFESKCCICYCSELQKQHSTCLIYLSWWILFQSTQSINFNLYSATCHPKTVQVCFVYSAGQQVATTLCDLWPLEKAAVWGAGMCRQARVMMTFLYRVKTQHHPSSWSAE